MKRITVFLLLCLSLILLCGCVFPLQHVSPDPEPASGTPESGAVLNPSDVAIPAPTADESPDPAAAEAVQQQDPQSEPVAIDNPKLAVFWYAMADAQVFSFREQFGPVLEASGFPFREFDAENDRYRQLDQIRDAVSGGWNLLAVQLVDDRSTEEAEEILELASGCPVIFFDRMPDSTLFADVLPAGCPNVGLVCTSPAELGSVQGKMIGNYLIDHFGTADLNQDGQIRYTFLVGDRYDPAALTLTQLALDSANAVLAGEGYRSLTYLDEEDSIGFQADPDGAWSSDAATALIRSDLEFYNYANANMIELVAANNDDMALGALTALQASRCNLGDGISVTIPLFGIGATPAARTAISLGQMTGTVDRNMTGYADAVLASIRGLAAGQSAMSVFSDLAASADVFSVPGGDVPILYVRPLPVLS